MTTTRKPATPSSPDVPATEEWTDLDPAQLEAAVADLTESFRPRYMIVERSLAALFPDGQRIIVPLDLPPDKLKTVMEGGLDEFEAMERIIGLFDQHTQDVLHQQGLVPLSQFIAKYFDVIGKISGVNQGK